MAGMEGGSWDAIEARWDFRRWFAMCRHWRDHGPPIHMAYYAAHRDPKADKFQERPSGEEFQTSSQAEIMALVGAIRGAA